MSARIHQARFEEALHALDFMLGWAGGWMPVRLDPDRVSFLHRTGVAGAGAQLARTVRWHDERRDTEIHVGLPWLRPDSGGVHGATVLWCRVEGQDQVARARRFRPLPSLVLQEGSSSRRWLIWALERPVDYFALKAANRKLAYALRAIQKWGDPDLVRFPCPGTCLRVDRSRPVPIVVGRLTTAAYEAGMIVDRLKEPPDPMAWLEGQQAR